MGFQPNCRLSPFVRVSGQCNLPVSSVAAVYRVCLRHSGQAEIKHCDAAMATPGAKNHKPQSFNLTDWSAVSDCLCTGPRERLFIWLIWFDWFNQIWYLVDTIPCRYCHFKCWGYQIMRDTNTSFCLQFKLVSVFEGKVDLFTWIKFIKRRKCKYIFIAVWRFTLRHEGL